MTLLEIMIVIVLIGVISSIVGINVKGSMDKAKKSQAQLTAEKIKNALTYAVTAEGKNLSEVVKNPKESLNDNPFVMKKDVDKILVDPWGVPYKIEEKDGEIIVESTHKEKD